MSILKNADNSDDLKDIINHYLESDRQGRITFLISEIKNNKYKRIAYVFCLLFILMKLKGENDEIVDVDDPGIGLDATVHGSRLTVPNRIPL